LDNAPIEIQIFERLVRMETKMDAFNSASVDHEGRIRKLEQFRWIMFGAASVLGGTSGVIGTLLLS
jgi:hypothetical protein